MSDREDLGDRTIEPTAKRLQDARDRGEVARSAEATGAVVLVAVILAAIVLVPLAWEGALRMLRIMLDPAMVDLGPAEVSSSMLGAARWMIVLGVPLAIVPFAAAFLAGLAQVGFRANPARIAPDPSHLDPMRGLQRVFGLDSVMKLMLDSVKVLLVLTVAGFSAWQGARAIVSLPALEAGAAIGRLAELALSLAFRTAGVLAVLAALDWLWQHHRWRRRLRMTRAELKDELRQSEGDPEMRLRRRQMARQIAMHRVTDAIPKSDVIVTNPDHISIALAYRPGRDRAPVVLAMGTDALALRMRTLALKHGVPIVERKPLARALWKQGDVGREVPPPLWKAVAEVLAFVHRLKGRAAA